MTPEASQSGLPVFVLIFTSRQFITIYHSVIERETQFRSCKRSLKLWFQKFPNLPTEQKILQSFETIALKSSPTQFIMQSFPARSGYVSQPTQLSRLPFLRGLDMILPNPKHAFLSCEVWMRCCPPSCPPITYTNLRTTWLTTCVVVNNAICEVARDLRGHLPRFNTSITPNSLQSS